VGLKFVVAAAPEERRDSKPPIFSYSRKSSCKGVVFSPLFPLMVSMKAGLAPYHVTFDQTITLLNPTRKGGFGEKGVVDILCITLQGLFACHIPRRIGTLKSRNP